MEGVIDWMPRCSHVIQLEYHHCKQIPAFTQKRYPGTDINTTKIPTVYYLTQLRVIFHAIIALSQQAWNLSTLQITDPTNHTINFKALAIALITTSALAAPN